MRDLYTAVVPAEEIDALGHMNVRFYMARAQRANQALMAGLGLDPAYCEGRNARLVLKDSYVRYLREQFQGATLVVRGGVIETGAESLRVYFELANAAKGEIAATFIMVVALADRATWAPLPIPQTALAAAADAMIAMPEHGRPRTIDLGLPRTDVTLETLQARLGEPSGDMMSLQMERTIEADSDDGYGFLSDGEDMMFGLIRMPPPGKDGRPAFGPMAQTSAAGHRFGWASMETRTLRLVQPRVGDTICSIGAEIGLHSKVRHSRRWMFNKTTGALVSLNDNVAIALDLDARRSIEIPSEIRGDLDRRHVPEFA